MPNLDQPPEPPAIVQPQQPQAVTPQLTTHFQSRSIVAPSALQSRASHQREIPPVKTALTLVQAQAVTPSYQAAALGPAIEVGVDSTSAIAVGSGISQPATQSNLQFFPAQPVASKAAARQHAQSLNASDSTQPLTLSPDPPVAPTTSQPERLQPVSRSSPETASLPPLKIRWSFNQQRPSKVSPFSSQPVHISPKQQRLSQGGAVPSTSPTPATEPPSPDAEIGVSPGTAGVIELKADRQEYDRDRQIFTAEGNVVMHYQNAILDADRLQVNLNNRRAVAEGNIVLVQGQQRLRGDRLEYNFVQGTGVVIQARGEVYLKDLGASTSPTLPTDVAGAAATNTPLSARLLANQPLRQVRGAGGITLAAGGGRGASLRGSQVFVPQAGGTVNRLRFEADRVDFYPSGWQASNIRITNDPFSPPELEVRARTARYRPISPFQDELVTQNARMVFDQRIAIPLPLQRTVFDRRRRDPGLAVVQFGYDAEERGGFFIEREFTAFSNQRIQWTITPQFLVQSAFGVAPTQTNTTTLERERGIVSPDTYGLKTEIDATLTPRTDLRGFLSLSSLDTEVIEDRLRASLRLRQNLSPFQQRPLCPPQPSPKSSEPQQVTPLPENCIAAQSIGNYALNLEYSYRDRLFNGSLGFQTVQQSFGAVLTSPIIPLGRTGINLSYQAGLQRITADTDRQDLLPAVRDNNRVSLGRFEASASLNRFFWLWQGKALPATAKEGLRYSPTPVVPYLALYTGLRGVTSQYTNGDNQSSLQASVGLSAQLGHFSRNFFDYTGLSVSYSETLLSGQSPFFFDRVADQRTVSAGITQQLFGPIRAGVQTSFNVNTGEEISTDYTVEYTRRTYSVIVRYNPVQEIGSINLLINDFNWAGGTDPFSTPEVRAVQGGVIRSND